MDIITYGALLSKAKPTDTQVTQAVDSWLEDHPEATTTVQDGAITYAKLDNNLQLELDSSDTYKSFTNSGEYIIKSEDIESGVWSYTTKTANTKRLRMKYMIPVHTGMVVRYINPTLDVYFGVAPTQTSGSTGFITSGWLNKGGNGVYTIPQDGFMTFNVRKDVSTTDITPADYDCTVSIVSDITRLVTSKMILTAADATAMFSGDANYMKPNKLYFIGTPIQSISNLPYTGFFGSVLTLAFRNHSLMAGRMQIALSRHNRLFARTNSSEVWGAWTEYADASVVQKAETVYYVGSTRENTSLVGLLKTIQANTDPAVIYIDEGTYDIFAEYKAYGIPSPPSDVQAADYFDYNVFLPQNCRLVGIGNVELVWNPTTSQITAAESKTWSPLNLWYGGNTIENITIKCKNGRYCIHDDSHNAYTGFINKYKNVRCIYTESDIGYGFNNVIGIGFEDKCTYEFDDCLLQYVGTGNHGVFYGHDGSAGGASIIVCNCVLLGGSDSNNMTIRLQSLRSDDSNRILTQFNGCYIQGGICLAQYNESAGQFFDVTLLRSGNPTQTIDDAGNLYPIKVYQ